MCCKMWKPLPKELLLSKYEISPSGEIRNRCTKAILQGSVYEGCVRMKLMNDECVPKVYMLHRLVALTFVKREDKSIVQHVNGNGLDNRAKNLRWILPAEKCNRGNKGNQRPVRQLTENCEEIKIWPSATEASRCLKISPSSISNACRNRPKIAGGFLWEFVENNPCEDETWVEIEDGIFISDLGRVEYRSGAKTYGSKSNGYLYVRINGRKYGVHQLIAEYFVPNDDPDNKNVPNHIDGNKTNNRAGNLEWGTQQHNVRHAIRTGLQKTTRANPSICSSIGKYDQNGEMIATYPSLYSAAKAAGINKQKFRRLMTGKYASKFNYRYLNPIKTRQRI